MCGLTPPARWATATRTALWLSANLLLAAGSARADWLSYRGPGGLGVANEKGWKAQFPKEGAKILWRANVGTGTSSFTVSGDQAYTMGNSGGKDRVYRLEAKTGREIWQHEYPLDVDKRMFEGGTAATPTLDGNRVYTVSHQGDLFCLDATSGKKVWYRHYQQDLGGKRPQWGYAGSPAIDGNLLICDVGGKTGSTVALDKGTGDIVWKSGEDEAGYASPVVATIGGKRTVVLFKGAALVGLDVKDGSELWRTLWKTSYEVNSATPLVMGDRIFVSSGYGAGCALFEVSGGKLVEKWRNHNLRSHINSPVAVKGAIYGMDGNVNPNLPLVCLDLGSGAVRWSQRAIGGALIAADGKLIILSENGELIVAEATTSGFHPLARAQVLNKRCWVQPTLDNGRVFCRNNQGEVACVELNGKP